jgi:hypothetical protein
MSHTPESFSAACNEFPPPGAGEYALEPILENLHIGLEELEEFGLFGPFVPTSLTIHKYSLSVVSSIFLRRGSGVDYYVILPNMLNLLLKVFTKGMRRNFDSHPIPDEVLVSAMGK